MDGAGADVLIMMCRYLAGPGASNSCWLGAFCKGGSKSVPSLRGSGSLYSSPQTVKASFQSRPRRRLRYACEDLTTLPKTRKGRNSCRGPGRLTSPGGLSAAGFSTRRSPSDSVSMPPVTPHSYDVVRSRDAVPRVPMDACFFKRYNESVFAPSDFQISFF